MPVSVPCSVQSLFYGKRHAGSAGYNPPNKCFAHFRRGHGGNGFFPTVGKIMLQSGASFGVFMGIGSLVRCDEDAKVERNL